MRRDGVDLSGMVFGGTHLKAGFRSIELPYSDEMAKQQRQINYLLPNPQK